MFGLQNHEAWANDVQVSDAKYSDYELWSPSDTFRSGCLFGIHWTYVRRKEGALCFHGEEFVRPMQSFRCACTITLLINWSTSELNRQLNPTTCLGDTDCWIQQVTAPTLVVTCWIQQSTCILPPSWTGGASPPCASRW